MNPSIVKIESQRVDRNYTDDAGLHTVVENIGYDANGQKWIFYNEEITTRQKSPSGDYMLYGITEVTGGRDYKKI